MRSLWALCRAHFTRSSSAARAASSHRSMIARCSSLCVLLALALSGCGTPVHLPVTGPGLRLVVAQGSQGAMRFWWLLPDDAASRPRLLLWDGTSVGISDPDASNQSFTPLGDGLICSQVALAPDQHAFACGLPGQASGRVLLQSLETPNTQPHILLDEQAPFAWSSDSQHLAAMRLNFSGTTSTCSLVAADTTVPTLSSDDEQVVLDQIPFNDALSKGNGACPVVDMAWSPDGARLALTLAAPDGVVLEVLLLGADGQPPLIETHALLPGVPLQAVDMPGVSSLFWSPDGQQLAALTGYRRGIEDTLFLLPVGQPAPQTGPNVIDTGSGAALAWSPDGRWLAAGTIGSAPAGENALLQTFDVTSGLWQPLAPMYVDGPTLAWSPDGTMLASASVSRKGVALWGWPSGALRGVVLNGDIASIEQLDWARDGVTLFFTLGSHVSPPVYDELYAQAIPVPPGVSSFAFPAWFMTLLALLPQGLIWLGAILLVGILLALLLLLAERGRSRRRRVFIRWVFGVGIALFVLLALLILSDSQLPGWLNGLYQPASSTFCQGTAPDPCSPAAVVATLALVGPLLLGLLVVLGGSLLTSRRPRPVVARGSAAAEPHPFLQTLRASPFSPPDATPLLLPPPGAEPMEAHVGEDEQDKHEH